MKKLFAAIAVALSLAGCADDADVVSRNISKAADNFEVTRRIVFYNGITGEYMLTIEGLCNRDNTSTAATLGVICQTGPGQYKKHLLGLSDNVTYFMEQVDAVKASKYFYRVTFKPTTIIPDIRIQ